MSSISVNTITDASGGSTTSINGLHEAFEYRGGKLYWKKNTRNTFVGDEAGGLNGEGYVTVGYKHKRLLAHRVIFAMHHGYLPEFVDHINGDKSDNRIENLRSASMSDNNRNRLANKNNKTGAKNVCWLEKKGKWLVQIMANRKRVVSKCFDDFELAELVAMEARNKYHGSFANHGAQYV